MKVLVIGGGGREHGLVWKLRQSPHIKKIYCAPGNGGISQDAECVPVDQKSVESMVALANQLKPENSWQAKRLLYPGIYSAGPEARRALP